MRRTRTQLVLFLLFGWPSCVYACQQLFAPVQSRNVSFRKLLVSHPCPGAHMPRIKPLASVALFCILCAMLLSPGRAQQVVPPPAQPAESKAKAELVSQLVATAEEARKQAQALYRAGLGTAQEMQTWTMRLADARLMAAKDKKSRVEILTARVTAAEELEKDASGRLTAALAREIDVTDARFVRIQRKSIWPTRRQNDRHFDRTHFSANAFSSPVICRVGSSHRSGSDWRNSRIVGYHGESGR